MIAIKIFTLFKNVMLNSNLKSDIQKNIWKILNDKKQSDRVRPSANIRN
jgi:hypothetical protein